MSDEDKYKVFIAEMSRMRTYMSEIADSVTSKTYIKKLLMQHIDRINKELMLVNQGLSYAKTILDAESIFLGIIVKKLFKE